MEAYLDQLIEWITTLSPLSIYSVFFIIAYMENILPPIPGDLLVAFGGYLAALQLVSFTALLILTTIASVIGFMSMYAVGSYWGSIIEEKKHRFWLMRFIDFKYYSKGKRWMQKWGQGAVLANRFLAGTRSVISLAAGITKTKVLPTIISSTISSVLWNFILLGAGWLVYENWQIIGDYLNIYGRIVIIGILIALAARWLYVRRRKKKLLEKLNREE
ncbi:MAG: DedA family protein [Balneolaceae bacterium]